MSRGRECEGQDATWDIGKGFNAAKRGDVKMVVVRLRGDVLICCRGKMVYHLVRVRWSIG